MDVSFRAVVCGITLFDESIFEYQYHQKVMKFHFKISTRSEM